VTVPKDDLPHSAPPTRLLGVIVIVVALIGSAVAGLFGVPLRILGVALGGPLVICGFYLFFGIPLRELVRRYKGFLIVWTVVFVGLLVYAGVHSDHPTAFDSSKWKARALDTDPMWPTRLRMVDDLLTRGLLMQKTRVQVEEVLGPGAATQRFKDWDLVYELGPERGYIRIDSEWLVIRFDEHLLVAEARILSD
jgi:hypothetical protein